MKEKAKPQTTTEKKEVMSSAKEEKEGRGQGVLDPFVRKIHPKEK